MCARIIIAFIFFFFFPFWGVPSAFSDDWVIERHWVGENLLEIESDGTNLFLFHKYLSEPLSLYGSGNPFIGIKSLNGTDLYKAEGRKDAPSSLKVINKDVIVFLPLWDDEERDALLEKGVMRINDFSVHPSRIIRLPSNEVLYEGGVSFEPSPQTEKDALNPLWDTSEEGLFLVKRNQVLHRNFKNGKVSILFSIPQTSPEDQNDERAFIEDVEWKSIHKKMVQILYPLHEPETISPFEIIEKIKNDWEVYNSFFELNGLPFPESFSSAWLFEEECENALGYFESLGESEIGNEEIISRFKTYLQWTREFIRLSEERIKNTLRQSPMGAIQKISVNKKGVYILCTSGLFRWAIDEKIWEKIADRGIRWFEADD